MSLIVHRIIREVTKLTLTDRTGGRRFDVDLPEPVFVLTGSTPLPIMLIDEIEQTVYVRSSSTIGSLIVYIKEAL